MRNGLIGLMATVALAACGVEDNGTTAQAIAGPGGVVVTARAPGQLAVSWSADPLASQYQVFQSAGDGSPALVASVFDSAGGPPATSYIADVLADGARYCYAIRAGYPDGATSELGAAGCSSSAAPPAPATRTVRSFPQFIRNTAFASPTECIDGAGVDRLCAVSTGAGAATIAVTYDEGLIPVSASIDVLGTAAGTVRAGLTLIHAPDSASQLVGIGERIDEGRTAQLWGALSVPASTLVPPLGPSSQFFLLVGVDGAGYGIGDVTVTYQ